MPGFPEGAISSGWLGELRVLGEVLALDWCLDDRTGSQRNMQCAPSTGLRAVCASLLGLTAAMRSKRQAVDVHFAGGKRGVSSWRPIDGAS